MSLAAWLFSARRSLQSDLLESLHVIAQITEVDSATSFAAFNAGKINAEICGDLPDRGGCRRCYTAF